MFSIKMYYLYKTYQHDYPNVILKGCVSRGGWNARRLLVVQDEPRTLRIRQPYIILLHTSSRHKQSQALTLCLYSTGQFHYSVISHFIIFQACHPIRNLISLPNTTLLCFHILNPLILVTIWHQWCLETFHIPF